MANSDFDLFGNPVRAGHGQRGRPRFQWTEEKSNKVKLGLALGWSNERIANGIAISVATLKRYFRAELKERLMARDQLELDKLSIAWGAAKSGNMGALRQVDRIMEANTRQAASDRLQSSAATAAGAVDPAEKLGKKAQARLAAQEAGGSDSPWGGLLSPGYKVN